MFYAFFFFQAEDGIRDATVTGVQTCALPICAPGDAARRAGGVSPPRIPVASCRIAAGTAGRLARRVYAVLSERSEERRVGKEGRWRGRGYGERESERVRQRG